MSNDAPVVRAVLAGHGELAAGMISAVEQITGRGNELVALSNRECSGPSLDGKLRDLIVSTGARVVFTDLPAGSCTMAARRLQREMPDLLLVTGANLATLLDFLGHDASEGDEAARSATEKGRASMGVVARAVPRGD